MKPLIPLVIIILVLFAGYTFFKGGSGSTKQGIENTQESVASVSLQSLVAAKKPVTCTFATTTAAGTQEGVVYVADDKVAGDFTISGSADSKVNAHLIVRDGSSYVWTSLTPQGFKMALTADQKAYQDKTLGYAATMDYRCTSWTPDVAKFVLPTGVTFTETGGLGVGQATTSAKTIPPTKGTAQQCAVCNQLSGTQKAQCLAALHC